MRGENAKQRIARHFAGGWLAGALVAGVVVAGTQSPTSPRLDGAAPPRSSRG